MARVKPACALPRPVHLLCGGVVPIAQSGLEQQQEAHGGAEDGVGGVGDEEVVVFFEVHCDDSVECGEHRQGCHLREAVHHSAARPLRSQRGGGARAAG